MLWQGRAEGSLGNLPWLRMARGNATYGARSLSALLARGGARSREMVISRFELLLSVADDAEHVLHELIRSSEGVSNGHMPAALELMRCLSMSAMADGGAAVSRKFLRTLVRYRESDRRVHTPLALWDPIGA